MPSKGSDICLPASLLREAEKFLKLGQLDQVPASLADSVQAQPGPNECWKWFDRCIIGAVLIDLGSSSKGLAYLDVSWLGSPPKAAGIAGAYLLKQGLLQKALPALQIAAAGLPDDPAHALNLGRCLTLLNRAGEALAHLKQGLSLLDRFEREGDHQLALRSLAEALQQLGLTEEALALLPADSGDEKLIAARAVLLASGGRHDEAAVVLAESLQARPELETIRLLAAELAELRGRSGEAIALLHQGLENDPDNLTLLLQLAGCGTRAFVPQQARDAAHKAMALTETLDPAQPLKRAQALVARGHVLAGDGDAEVAEEAYRQSLELVLGFVPALSGLGQLLLERGQVEEAIHCYEQVRARTPLAGWSQLIHARQVPDDPALLEQLEAAARQPSLEGPVRSGLLFTLAAAYDKQKNYARAIELAAEANAASKDKLPYKPEAHRARVERELAFFSAAFMAHRRQWGSPSQLPVFVLGMPRSGTTLTEQILASHSLVYGAGELGQIGEQITRMEMWEWKLGTGLPYPDCLWDLTAPECKGYAERLLESLQAYCPTAQRVVDKLPHNFEHVGLIKLLFPNARILHIRRDSRDIAISNFFTDYGAKFGGMGFAYDWQWIGEQLVDHDRQMAHWHRLFPEQILEVPYEELVADTESWARRMIDFLALEWEPGVLEFQSLERSVKTASVWQVRQPVYKSSTERWKRYGDALAPLEAALAAEKPADPLPLEQPAWQPGQFAAGMAALQKGQAERAQQLFAELLVQRPVHAAAHHFLGASLTQLGQLEAARDAMGRSLELHPIQPSWLANLAAIEEELGNSEAAVQLRVQRQWLLDGKPPQAP